MSNIENLLKEWAELEPDRCKKLTQDEADYFKVLRYDVLGWVGPRLGDGGFYLDTIQGATQQALEASGFDCNLRYRHNQKQWKAEVFSADKLYCMYNKVSAEALLSAYLKALAVEVEG